MKQKSKNKHRMLDAASRSVARFYPEHAEVFICPACLRKIPISKTCQITDAHILPKAAGGKIKTFLCQRCNSRYGSAQDKWLGEYLNMLKPPGLSLSLFKAKQQDGYFDINGQRVNGRYCIGSSGEIVFFTTPQANSPDTLKQLDERVAQAKEKGSLLIQVPIPIIKNSGLLDIGFITAGYLLWFKEVGYSWVFQAHLDIVREQINNPTISILPKSAVGICKTQMFNQPCIGVGKLVDELVLFAAIANRVIFFPPVDRPNFYSVFPTDLKGLSGNILKVFKLNWLDESHIPCGILWGDRMVVAPDIFVRGEISGVFVYFPEDGSEASLLYPLSAEDAASRQNQPGDTQINVRPNITAPIKDTGR